jgi:hypothetical protein
MHAIIEVNDLHKRFGRTVALDGMSFAGLAVLCGYAALALGLAAFRVEPQGRMRRELHAEWTKLRTLADTGWLLLAAVAASAGLSTTVAAAVTCPPAGCADERPQAQPRGNPSGTSHHRHPRGAGGQR